jgi:hypothetical protein
VENGKAQVQALSFSIVPVFDHCTIPGPFLRG